MNKITVLVKRVEEDFKVESIDNTLEAFQKFVGGYIEVLNMGSGIVAIMNEEGKLKDMKANLPIHRNGILADILHGDIMFAGTDGSGDMDSISDEQVEMVKQYFNY